MKDVIARAVGDVIGAIHTIDMVHARTTTYFKTIAEGSVDQMDIKDGKFAGKVEIGERRVEVCRYGEGEPIPIGQGFMPNRIETLPARYNYESELQATVTEKGPNEFSFAATSK